MKSRADPFAVVKSIGMTLPGVESSIKYDGAPVLKVGGAFMAAIATHSSAEPASLVVRVSLEDRELLLADAPDTYYVTEYYEKHPVVLVRLSRIDRDALRDVLSMSRRLTLPKVGHRAKPSRASSK